MNRIPAQHALPFSQPPRRHAVLARGVGILLLAGSALLAGQAGAAPRGPGGMDGACDMPMMGFMGGPGEHMMGGKGGQGSPVTPEQAQARAVKMIKHLAVEANATPEQTARLEDIAKAAAAELLPLRSQMHDNHQARRAALLATTIDRAKLETLRVEHLRLADALSRRMNQAIADAADVLSPEQRQAVAEHMAKRSQHHGRHGGR